MSHQDHLLDGHLHRFCGGRYQRATEHVTIRVSGMQADVDRDLYRCGACGHEQRTVEQRETAERAAIAHMRATHGLLTPREVRQLRDAIGVTAAQLGELCYGLPKGVVDGWERGRYLQNRAADALLRTLRDPEALATRARKAGVLLPSDAPPSPELGSDPALSPDGGSGTARAAATAYPDLLPTGAPTEVAR